jgi:hypothetical protein
MGFDIEPIVSLVTGGTTGLLGLLSTCTDSK